MSNSQNLHESLPEKKYNIYDAETGQKLNTAAIPESQIEGTKQRLTESVGSGRKLQVRELMNG